MGRLTKEMELIPKPAYVVAALVGLTVATVMYCLPLRLNPQLRQWPLWGKVLSGVGVSLPLTIYVMLIGYVNGDAKRRGMRRLLWTLVTIFVPNALGIILYFILREPILGACTRCGTLAKAEYAFCPKCGEARGPACPRCRKAVEQGWTVCAYCGARLG